MPSGEETASNFPSPPPEDGMVLWWGWDGPVTEAEVYFFFNESPQAQSCQATLAGHGQAQVWVSESGCIKALDGALVKKNEVSIPLDLQPYEAKCVVFSSSATGRG
jgi:hypothetical protein